MRGVPYEFQGGGVGAGGCDLMHINQLYEEVIRRIISETEAGAVPCLKPWKAQPGDHTGVVPQNAATGRAYHGINIPLLWHVAAAKAYATHAWLTYKQAEALKAQVRNGERSTTIVFTKRITVKDRDTEDEKAISMLKTFSVFNVSSTMGRFFLVSRSAVVVNGFSLCGSALRPRLRVSRKESRLLPVVPPA